MKGDYGNIRSRRRSAILRTAVLAGFSLAIFLIGFFLYHTNRNLMSVIAAIGAIPTGLSAVNMILFIKAKPLSQEAYDTIEAHRGKLLIRYELEMTSYDRTWHIGAATALQKNICLFTEDKTADLNACEKHIREQLSIGGYPDATVKVFGDLAQFTQRLNQLEKLRDTMHVDPAATEAAWQPGTTQTPAGILMSISL